MHGKFNERSNILYIYECMYIYLIKIKYLTWGSVLFDSTKTNKHLNRTLFLYILVYAKC